MPVNGQYSSPPFGLAGDYSSTGAPGSQGIQDAAPGVGGGGVVATVPVTTLYQSTQDPSAVQHVPVTFGDTTANSADSVVPASGDPMTGLSLDQLTSTGAGQGSGEHFPHPAAGGGAA